MHVVYNKAFISSRLKIAARHATTKPTLAAFFASAKFSHEFTFEKIFSNNSSSSLFSIFHFSLKISSHILKTFFNVSLKSFIAGSANFTASSSEIHLYSSCLPFALIALSILSVFCVSSQLLLLLFEVYQLY